MQSNKINHTRSHITLLDSPDTDNARRKNYLPLRLIWSMWRCNANWVWIFDLNYTPISPQFDMALCVLIMCKVHFKLEMMYRSIATYTWFYWPFYFTSLSYSGIRKVAVWIYLLQKRNYCVHAMDHFFMVIGVGIEIAVRACNWEGLLLHLGYFPSY